MSLLADKAAVVLGGTGGLGATIVTRLEQQGCRVFATYNSEPGRARSTALQVRAKFFRTDVTNEEDVRLLFDNVLADSPRIDIVVNTVGGYLPRKTLAEVSTQDWDLMMGINLRAAFLVTRESLRRMAGQASGRIINISAMTGVRPLPERIPYSISKASVSLLSELAAQEVKGSGITVNAIAPGVIATAANLDSMPGEDTSRWVTPDQIADIIMFLCTPSGASINGTTIRASGGL